MPCTLATGGYKLDCRISGGLDVVYASDLVKDQVYAYDTAPDDNIILGTDVTSGSIMTFETLEQEIETASVIETITATTENGTVYYEQAIAIKLFGNTDKIRTIVENLSKGRFTMICKDQEGQDKIYGKQNGLRVTEGSIETGVAFGDMNGATVTLLAKEPQPANLVVFGSSGADDEFVIVAAS